MNRYPRCCQSAPGAGKYLVVPNQMKTSVQISFTAIQSVISWLKPQRAQHSLLWSKAQAAFMPVLNTTHHPENRETTVLLRPKDLHRPSLAGLVVFVAIYFNCQSFAHKPLFHTLKPHFTRTVTIGGVKRECPGSRQIHSPDITGVEKKGHPYF